MKRSIKTIIAVALASTLAIGASAISSSDKTPQRLELAYEVIEEENNLDKAMELAREQVKETPGCTEAHMLMCRIYRTRKEYGSALSCVNEAIRVNKPKKSGFSDAVLYWWKACIYDSMGEDEMEVKWLESALENARKNDKGKVQNISFDLGQAYYEVERLEEADAVYNKMLMEDETDQGAMIGLARNMIARGENAEAVKVIDRCQKYDEDYSATYKYRSKAYDAMGETDKAIDDALLWFEKDEDAISYPKQIVEMMLKHSSYAIARTRSMMKSSDRKNDWTLLLIAVYEKTGDYEQAIETYDYLEKEYGKDEFIYFHRADCYDEIGLSEMALNQIDKAIEMCDDYANNCGRGSILRGAGRYGEAEAAFDRAIELQPDNVFAYYAKGWCYELAGDDVKAMECYDQGIDIDKDYAYIYLMRGQLLLKKGDRAAAENDFEAVLRIDTTATDGSCRQYALHFLGRNDEADEWMQKIIEKEPYDYGHYYDKACLNARMGKTKVALEALEKALEMGYCKFSHIEHDDDLDAIKGTDEFKALISRYEAELEKRREKYASSTEVAREEKITEVPISRHAGGTFDVDCNVNGLALSMIFDTGASDVTISKVEADFMLKNRYLSKEDIKGKKYYQIADGGVSEGTVVTLKEVRIGDAVLRNVDASVVKSQKAPLLLGQSVLEKFGTFTVDNINSRLIIKH